MRAYFYVDLRLTLQQIWQNAKSILKRLHQGKGNYIYSQISAICKVSAAKLLVDP